jgi:oligopeptidase A
LHREYRPGAGPRPAELLAELRRALSVVPVAEYDRFAHGFAHIFGGVLCIRDSCYLGAVVLSADAFGAFEENGLFDAETGQRFRDTVLALGGSKPAAEVFRAFRGRDPKIDAFLHQHGIGEAA